VPALDQVDLTGRAGDRVGEFSQGMRQRLGIARVLIGDPPVVILDEPTNGLDPQGIRWIRDLVRRLADEGRTVVLSSHLLAEVQVLADDIAVIAQGAVAAYGPAAEVLRADVTLEQFYFETLARTTPSTPVGPAE
jgi:ABC-2 type transport system ATP-binding protein